MKTAEKIIRDGNRTVKLTSKQISRFWNKVQKTEGDCWEWHGTLNNCGYGRVNLLSNHKLAHRISWMLNRGDIPPKSLILHRCDNPKCVNPKHLFIGTNRDNSDDMIAKGRGTLQRQKGADHYSKRKPELVTRGEKKGTSKLTSGDVLKIRKQYATGNFTYKELAKGLAVSSVQIGRIVRRLDWQHI